MFESSKQRTYCANHLDGPHSRVPVGRFKIGLTDKEKQDLVNFLSIL
jgi:hypothetical protein